MNWSRLALAVAVLATIGLIRLGWVIFRRWPASPLVPVMDVLIEVEDAVM